MKYIIQINTGNLHNKLYDTKEIITKLDEITSKINLSKAIIGWYPDFNQNKDLIDYLKSKGVESYFWLPVFAEITHKELEDQNIQTSFFNEGDNTFTKNDKFEFVCESSLKNMNYIISKFEEYTEGLNFDGVFLDRIRYQSPTVNKDAIFGCMCDNCKKIYQDNGINISKLDESIYDNLIPSSLKDGIYQFKDNNANKLMKVKREIITNQITYLYNYFKSKDLKVGLDAFALSFADFVGQDIVNLSKCSDYIKPMFYLKTTAPAGVPYELKGLGKNIESRINELWENDVTTIDGTISQIEYLEKYSLNICPGIDVNNIEGICSSNIDYVLDYVSKLKKTNTKEIVLSWNALMIDSKLLDSLKE